MDKRLAMVKIATKALVEDETSGGIYIVPTDYSGGDPNDTFTLGELDETLNSIRNYLLFSLSGGVMRDESREIVIDSIEAVQKFFNALYGKGGIIGNIFKEGLAAAKSASGTEMLSPEQHDAIMAMSDFTSALRDDLSSVTQYGPMMRIPVMKSRFASTPEGKGALTALIAVRDTILNYQDTDRSFA